MSKTFMKITGLLLGAMSLFALPPAAIAADGTTSSFTISVIGGREMGLDVFPNGTFTEPYGCSNDAAVRVPSTAANYNAIASLVTTAYATGKKVHFWINACSSDGEPSAEAVWIGS